MPLSLSSVQRELSSAAARKAVNSVASRHTNSFGKRSIQDVLEDPGEDEEDESFGQPMSEEEESSGQPVSEHAEVSSGQPVSEDDEEEISPDSINSLK